MNFNDDDRYLVNDETGEVMRVIGYSNPERQFIRVGAKEHGCTWMTGLSAKYEIPRIVAGNEFLKSGTRIELSGRGTCATGVNMGTRMVWLHGPCGTMTMTRDETAALILALEHSIEQLDVAEFRENMKKEAA